MLLPLWFCLVYFWENLPSLSTLSSYYLLCVLQVKFLIHGYLHAPCIDSSPMNTFFSLLLMIAFCLTWNFLTRWLVVRPPKLAAPTFPSWSHAWSPSLHTTNRSSHLCIRKSDFGLCSSACMLQHVVLLFISPSNFMHVAITHPCISHMPRFLSSRVHLRSS
jgi:hypothetical protein